jgi:predicted Co/Zn/Cd cation transporter (cation efflux family)
MIQGLDDAEVEREELSALDYSKWVNLFMGVAGVVAAIVSHATALVLDGLFSGVNFLAAVLAGRVAKSIRRPADANRPFGYEIDEPVYIMFRSLVLTGIIIVALFNAVAKVVAYFQGKHIEEIVLGPIVGYMVLMIVLCFGLASIHHRKWIATGRQSELLKSERSVSVINGILSAAMGLAFIGIAMLKNTPLSFLTPISDSIVVTGLALYMIGKPIRSFSDALAEVIGVGAPEEMARGIRQAMSDALKDSRFEFLGASVTKSGRTLFALAHVRPDQPTSAEMLDEIRDRLRDVCNSLPHRTVVEIVYTTRAPYENG